MMTNYAPADAKLLLAAAFEVTPDEIPDNASIETYEPWDSLGHVKVIMRVEEVLGRALETEEVVSIFDLYSIAGLLASARRVAERQ